MSAKKKKKNRARQEHKTQDVATEKLTKQLNSEDEEPAQSTTESILAEYERKVEEAEQRKAERLRVSEQERAEKELRASTPYELKPLGSTEPEIPPEPETVPEEPSPDSDVKQFVMHSIKRPEPQETKESPEESVTEGFNKALSEDYEELESDNLVPSETDEPEAETAPARPNKFYLVFAVFVIIMSVIGIVSTVNFAAGVVSDIANRTDLKNELALFLYPVVCVDPPDCDTVDELPPNIIVESAIWRIILTGDNSNYEKLYNTYMYVPAIDVEYSVRSIFGNSVKIEHQTVGTMDITFTYVPDTNSYLVPINPHYTAYSPRITDVSNVGELYTVTVDYIPPSALAVEGIEFEVSSQKTMVYTLSKSKNTSTIHSIKNITRLDNSYAY
ncbi:MAG: hypothetical protein IK093_18445 [Ruminiclostridium sp.]|nr:hypothetical protein [Ruminiclostridium sp.]